MSDDEKLVLMISLGAGLVLWGLWYYRAFRPPNMIFRYSARWPLLYVPPMCGLLLLWVLLALAADDVREAPQYVAMYLLMGAAWVALAIRTTAMFGISVKQDFIERRNRAVGSVLVGAMIGLTLSFAGGNIGNGPGWWVVVFSAGLATAALLGLWMVVDLVAGVTDVVLVQRDRAAGLRLGAMLVAGGLILGRSVAGDWHSTGQTIADFIQTGWPAAILAGVEIALTWAARPTRYNPVPSVLLAGAVPALAYVVLAGAYLHTIGWCP